LILLPACAPLPVRTAARPEPGNALRLAGAYTARFSAPYVGTFTTTLLAEPTKDGFRANTRPGAAWPLVGGVESVLGPIFMPYLFPGGAILTWAGTLPAEGKPGEGWLGPGGIRRVGIRTVMESLGGPVRLVLPDGRSVGLMTLAPAPAQVPKADYTQVAARIDQAMRERLYTPPVNGKAGTPSGLEGYLAQVRSAGALARDDVEFAFGVAMAARSNLKFYPLPLRRLSTEAGAALRSWPERDLTSVQWSVDTESGIATVKPEVFLATADVDAAMRAVLAGSPRAIIIDLRNCQGVELSALRVAAWLCAAPLDAGTFLTRDAPAHAPDALLRTAADFDEAGDRLDGAGALRLVVEPVEHPFSGPVAILTGKGTAGSGEALASALRGIGRVILVGEPTAGRVILSRPVDVGGGWVLRLPAAGWLPPSGAANPKGAEPDIRASAGAAPTRAAEALTGPDADP
jgi:hypothetical protein